MSAITNIPKTIVQTPLPLASSPATSAKQAQQFNLSRALLGEGWTNNPTAQRNVTEWAIHNVVSEILRTFVSVDEGGKSVGQRPVSAGQLLDLLNGTIPALPGKTLDGSSNLLVVDRPASRPASAGETTVSSVKPSRARAAQLLSGLHLHDKKNLGRFLNWALQRGYTTFLTLGHEPRKMLLAGKGVHPDSVITTKTTTK